MTKDTENKKRKKSTMKEIPGESERVEADSSIPTVYFGAADAMLDRFRKELFSSGWESFRNYMLPRDIHESELERFVRNPLTNISSDEKNFIVKLEVPGLDKNEIDISIKNRVLRIKGESKEEFSKEDEEFLRKEYHSTKFYRSYTLPEEVDEEKITASLDKGVLQIELPKAKKSKTDEKKIAIR